MGDRAPHATERSGRAPRAAPTHPFSWGAVWACVSLDTGTNRSVSLGLDRPEPRGGGQAEHGAHLIASLAFLSGGSWLSRLSLRGQALIHLRPPGPRSPPRVSAPRAWAPRPCCGGRWGRTLTSSPGGPVLPCLPGSPSAPGSPWKDQEGWPRPARPGPVTPCRPPSPRLRASPTTHVSTRPQVVPPQGPPFSERPRCPAGDLLAGPGLWGRPLGPRGAFAPRKSPDVTLETTQSRLSPQGRATNLRSLRSECACVALGPGGALNTLGGRWQRSVHGLHPAAIGPQPRVSHQMLLTPSSAQGRV